MAVIDIGTTLAVTLVALGVLALFIASIIYGSKDDE